MVGAACGALVRRGTLIVAGGFARQGRAGVILSYAIGIPVVRGPHKGDGQGADLIYREGGIA